MFLSEQRLYSAPSIHMKSEHHCKESTIHKRKPEKSQKRLHYTDEKVPHTCQPLIKSGIFNGQITEARHGEQLPEYKLTLPATLL